MSGIRLLLIDGMSIIRRVYEAIGGDHTEDRAEQAVISCVGSFNRCLNSYNPTHVLCVADASGNNWRHEVYPNYKANREGCPEVLTNRLTDLADYLYDMQIGTVAKVGFEADDIIASIVQKLQSHCEEIVVVSQDKDMLQLVTDNVIVRRHFAKPDKGEQVDCDAQYVVDRYGVEASQFGDYLALVGDKADNVPGLNGVGEKRATELLQQHGSIENLLNRLNEFEGRVLSGETVEGVSKSPEARELIGLPSVTKALLTRKADLLLSKELVSFRDVTLNLSLTAIRYERPTNKRKMKNRF